MEMQPVESSNLARIGHDAQLSILVIEFTNGVLWKYEGVTPELFAQLQNAPSKGRFFNQEIRPKFKGEKIEALPETTATTETPIEQKTEDQLEEQSEADAIADQQHSTSEAQAAAETRAEI
jgi:hypothetical protein